MKYIVTQQARLEALWSLAADVVLLPNSATEREGVELSTKTGTRFAPM